MPVRDDGHRLVSTASVTASVMLDDAKEHAFHWRVAVIGRDEAADSVDLQARLTLLDAVGGLVLEPCD